MTMRQTESVKHRFISTWVNYGNAASAITPSGVHVGLPGQAPARRSTAA
jgi:hypothetical protein